MKRWQTLSWRSSLLTAFSIWLSAERVRADDSPPVRGAPLTEEKAEAEGASVKQQTALLAGKALRHSS